MTFQRFCLVLVCALLPSVGWADAQPTRRFALLAGANDGGPDRVALRYAVTDMHAVGGVLVELGGVRAPDLVVLEQPDNARLRAGFAQIAQKLEAARATHQRVEVLFYYSGHSDEQGLMLGQERTSYRDLRAAIDALPADVRIAIVDACASGVLTRGKGGRQRPGFLLDQSSKVQGYAILTSASADEAAQESDHVGGSFFTHYLISGLRGAADATNDGRVTLNEAYQFAYHETLARTEQTRIGAQHPNYDLQLTGQGDVVLTDVQATGAGLVLHKALSGRLYVRDGAGRLVAELAKPAGRVVALGFAAGDYQITLSQEGQLSRTSLHLQAGMHTALSAAAFDPIDGEITAARGGVTASATQPAPSAPLQPFAVSVVPGLDTHPDHPTTNSVALNVLVGQAHQLRGVEVSGIGGIRTGPVQGVQGAGIFNVAGGAVKGVQGAGIFNVADGGVLGVQSAGIFNVAGGGLRGVQGAGIFNHSGGDTRGAQAAGIFNHSDGSAEGVQAAGIFNRVEGDVRGVQAAGIFNSTGGQLEGVQVGLVNHAGRVRGLQVGLVNRAEHVDGLPLGLINIIDDGIQTIETWGSDVAPVNLGVKLGSHRFYTTFTGAKGYTEGQYLLGFGLGGHISLGDRFDLDIDVLGHRIYDDLVGFTDTKVDILARARLTVGARIGGHVRLFAGVAANQLISSARSSDDLRHGLPSLSHTDHEVTITYWPGALVGVGLY
jgi:hypothetical protein